MTALTALTQELVELIGACEEVEVPILIGGGLGLYIRDFYLLTERSPRYPVRVEPRTTDDIDCFLIPDVITSREKMEALRDVIHRLRYEPVVEHMQFEKRLDANRGVKIDLLAALPKDQSGLTGNAPRVRPKGVKNIHAYRTPEAASIMFEPRMLHVGECQVSIPASINFLIMKLHAFRDRCEKEVSDYGRHHALDIFRIITGMDEADWASAGRFADIHNDDGHVREARIIRHDFFDDRNAPGVLRIRENISFKGNESEFSGYIENFLTDFRELLPPLP